MNTLSLEEFAPIISDRKTGDRIYNLIRDLHPESHVINVDLIDIKSMAIFCAKQIFGKLYLELTPPVFYNNIKLSNATEDVQLIIKLGIQSAVNEAF